MSGETAGGGGGGHGGHGGATAMLMARAARGRRKDEIAKQTERTKEGMPLWVLVVGLFACILLPCGHVLSPSSDCVGGTGAVMVFSPI